MIATTFFARLLPASCRPRRRAPAATQWAKDLDAEVIEETTAGVEGPSAPVGIVQMKTVGEQHDTEGENREAEAGPGPDEGVGSRGVADLGLVGPVFRPRPGSAGQTADFLIYAALTTVARRPGTTLSWTEDWP